MTTTNQQSWTQKNSCIATGRDGTSITVTTTIPGHPSATNRSRADSASVISVKQYAQHQGVTVQAIYQRIQAGQLGDAVQRAGGRYLIHRQQADVAWAMRGRPANSRAAQLEARLMLLPDQLAEELAGMDATYCRVALTRVILNLLN
jgi:hypothetical protein